nr:MULTISPECIES: CotD family spore coat protein [Bacillus]
MPAQVSPTQQIVQKNVFKHIVPHIHPTHTTTVNEHVYQHQHYFPHTQSVVNECCNQQVMCGPLPPPMPSCFCPPRPFC